ncbi:MAG: restriction endonuclease subunit S, partial [bacterium]
RRPGTKEGRGALQAGPDFQCQSHSWLPLSDDRANLGLGNIAYSQKRFLQFTLSQYTSTYPNIKWSDYKELVFPLPPLPEQRRIAAILKERMAAVDRLRKALEEQLEAINKLPAAILRKAFSGEL